MFGYTTPFVEVATQKLEGLDYSVVTLHVTGAGGLAMETHSRGSFRWGP